MLSNPEFEYHGTVYPSLKVCCEELGINKSSVISRSHRPDAVYRKQWSIMSANRNVEH